MASRIKTQTTTKRGSLKEVRQRLESLSSQTAQIIRMKHGLSGDDEDVGEPSDECSATLRRRLMAIERSIIERACGRSTISSAPKQKIIEALREKS